VLAFSGTEGFQLRLQIDLAFARDVRGDGDLGDTVDAVTGLALPGLLAACGGIGSLCSRG
jgi:hypothetical protein